jgi:hypothetical protein
MQVETMLDVFSKEKSDNLLERTPFNHAIDLEPGKMLLANNLWLMGCR